MSGTPVIDVQGITYQYGSRIAVRDLGFQVESGEVFALLGPNGSGKTTLFRLLSTLLPLQQGTARILGISLGEKPHWVQQRLGVVFQSPSLDPKLTVVENLRCQASLYGLWGRARELRQEEVLRQLGLQDRGRDRVETLSGGLKRRVDLAKSLMHRPDVLVLDEPTTGLDPGARGDLWNYLRCMQQEYGLTVVMTTHLLDEGDRADRIGILHEGNLVALDSPENLRGDLGGEQLTITCTNPAGLRDRIEARFGLAGHVMDGKIRLSQLENDNLWQVLREEFRDEVDSMMLAKPTLEDVFIDKTGQQFQPAVRGEEDLV